MCWSYIDTFDPSIARQCSNIARPKLFSANAISLRDISLEDIGVLEYKYASRF